MRVITTILVLCVIPSAGCRSLSPQDVKPKGKFTIGKETTFFTGPVDKDGLIDYWAAMNERLGQGATPENNAVVLIWKALGPRPERAPLPPEFFKLLKIEEPPEKGEYFVHHIRYAKEQLKIEKEEALKDIHAQLDRCIERSWSAKDHPHIAAWLEANEKPLGVIIEATKRSHYFSPLWARSQDKATTISALMPGVQMCREVANALAARALLHVEQGKADDAWQDLLACHRLGRQVGRGGTEIDMLVAVAIDRTACQADLAFLAANTANARRLENCLRDLKELPPMPPVADKVDVVERCVFLQHVTLINRHGNRYLNENEKPKADDAFTDAVLATVDWDPGLRNANAWYDRIVAALRLKERGAREKELSAIGAELEALLKAGKGAPVRGPAGAAQLLGVHQGNLMIGLHLISIRKVATSTDRCRQNEDNVEIAFALAWYRCVEGHYPKELKALAPKYLPEVPQDIFSGKSLVYRPGNDGYLLYSVGPNGKDEDGHGPEDEPKGDDVSVRMPLPLLKRE